MRRIGNLLFFYFVFTFTVSAASYELREKLLQINDLSEIDSLSSGEFAEKYVMFIKQPLDHRHPEAGTFKQRVVISHVGFDRPTVLVTEGYGGEYALRSSYREELSRLFNTNLVFVEHRYFLESTPEPLNWEYLTAENSAYDLHHVFSEIKKIYPQKWISTGISKGGQTTIIYRTFFPEDMDISVPYVAPVCKGVEDGRHEPFLRQVSTEADRKKVQDFQVEVLKRRQVLLPLFESYCKERSLTFRVPLDEVYDYCVLEYSFSLWQWGTPVSSIPEIREEDAVLFDHLMQISGPSYFAENQPTVSFFIQAARELGYYGYDIKPFKEYLSIKTGKDYLRRMLLPEGVDIEFNPALYNRIRRFIRENDPQMIFIYGESDPWTSAGITNLRNKRNMFVAIQPGGSHLARIATLPEELKEKVVNQIRVWLEGEGRKGTVAFTHSCCSE